MSKHYNIPIFVPHAGCPHDCVFCNQKKITGLEEALDLTTMQATIDAHLTDIRSRSEEALVEIAFFGGSFTGIPLEHQKDYLSLAYDYKKAGLIDGIRLSTRPDYIDTNILEHLKSYGVTTIELGVQSLDDQVLTKSKRGHSIADVSKACQLIKAYDISLGLQMMIGLPGDDRIKMMKTAEIIRDNHPAFIRIYPTLVIKDTELEALYKQGLYQPLSLEEAVEQTTLLYRFFKSSDIDIIRMGLQPTEDLENGAMVSGPYHPAFRQLVESNVYKLVIDDMLSRYEIKSRLVIYVPKDQISNVVGQKRVNLHYFETKYQLGKIKVYGKDLPDNTFELDVDGTLFRGHN